MTKMSEIISYTCPNQKANSPETKDIGVKIKEEHEDVVEIFAEDITDYAELDQIRSDPQEYLHTFLPSNLLNPKNDSILIKSSKINYELTDTPENNSKSTESQKQAQNLVEKSNINKDTTFQANKECFSQQNKFKDLFYTIEKSAISNENPSILPKNNCATLRALLEKPQLHTDVSFMLKQFNQDIKTSNMQTKESFEEEPAVKVRFTDSGREWIYKSKPKTFKNANITKKNINAKKPKQKKISQKRSLPPLVPLKPKKTIKSDVPPMDIKNSPYKHTTSDSDIEADFEDKSAVEVGKKVKEYLINKFLNSKEQFIPKDDVVVIIDSEDEEISDNGAQTKLTQDGTESNKTKNSLGKTDNTKNTAKETSTAMSFDEAIIKNMQVTVRYIPESHQIILENHSNKSINIPSHTLSSVLNSNIKNGIDMAARKTLDKFVGSEHNMGISSTVFANFCGIPNNVVNLSMTNTSSAAKNVDTVTGTSIKSNITKHKDMGVKKDKFKSEHNKKVKNEFNEISIDSVGASKVHSISSNIDSPQLELFPQVTNFYITEAASTSPKIFAPTMSKPVDPNLPRPKFCISKKEIIPEDIDLNSTRTTEGSVNEEQKASDSDEDILVISEEAQEQAEEELKKNVKKKKDSNKNPLVWAMQTNKRYKEALLKKQTPKDKMLKCAVAECQFKVPQTHSKRWRDVIWDHYTLKHHTNSTSNTRLFPCEDKLCPHTFGCKRSQILHVVEYHDRSSGVFCPICTFTAKLQLVSTHFELHGVLNPETNYTKCGLCGFSFNPRTRLRHLLYHTKKAEKERLKNQLAMQATVDLKVENSTDNLENKTEINKPNIENQTNKQEIKVEIKSENQTCNEEEKQEQTEKLHNANRSEKNTTQKHTLFNKKIANSKQKPEAKREISSQLLNIKSEKNKKDNDLQNKKKQTKKKVEKNKKDNDLQNKKKQNKTIMDATGRKSSKKIFKHVHSKKNLTMQNETTESPNKTELNIQAYDKEHMEENSTNSTIETISNPQNSYDDTKPNFVVPPRNIKKLKSNGLHKGSHVTKKLKNKPHLNGIFKNASFPNTAEDVTMSGFQTSTENDCKPDQCSIIKGNQSTKSDLSRKMLKRSSTDDFTELKCKKKIIKVAEILSNLKSNKVGVPYPS